MNNHKPGRQLALQRHVLNEPLLLIVVALSALILCSCQSPAIPPSSQATPVSPQSPSVVTSADLMAVYKDLTATINILVVAAAALGTVISLMIVVTGGTTVPKAREAAKTAEEANKKAQEIQHLQNELRKELDVEKQAVDAMRIQATATIAEIEKNLARINDMTSGMGGDNKVLERLLAVAEVDRYSVVLLGDDPMRRQSAKVVLREMVKKDDPIVRRDTLRVFKSMPTYLEDWFDPEIQRTMQEVAERDPEQVVRTEARLALKEWERLRAVP